MKIIKHGIVVEHKTVCKQCGCEFTFTSKDIKRYPALGEEWVDCPDCGRSLDTEEYTEGCEQVDNK